jgi:hypothetical protein
MNAFIANFGFNDPALKLVGSYTPNSFLESPWSLIFPILALPLFHKVSQLSQLP